MGLADARRHPPAPGQAAPGIRPALWLIITTLISATPCPARTSDDLAPRQSADYPPLLAAVPAHDPLLCSAAASPSEHLSVEVYPFGSDSPERLELIAVAPQG
eukprot:5713232-Pyramimonas_sp.AAC.1